MAAQYPTGLSATDPCAQSQQVAALQQATGAPLTVSGIKNSSWRSLDGHVAHGVSAAAIVDIEHDTALFHATVERLCNAALSVQSTLVSLHCMMNS